MAIYYFARCELDTDRRVLKVADIARDIEPQVFDLLSLLVDRGDSVVSRDDLIEHVWRGRLVSDSAISVRINAARKAIGDSGADQAILKTVQRRGFRLVVPVTKREIRIPVTGAAQYADSSDELAISNGTELKPVLAVFPFDLQGAAVNQQHFSRGIADDIATELSRFHMLAVISTLSSFQFDPSIDDANTFAKSLGANYIITGSFQRSIAALKMTISLTDAKTRAIVWSDKYHFSGQEIFDVQDEAVSEIVGVLFSQLHEYQMAAARKKPTANLSAYECLLRATTIYKVGDVTPADSKRALYWFNRTLKLDPFSARAMAWRVCCGSDFQPNPEPREFFDSAMQSMSDALSLDSGDHEVHRIVGALHLICGNRDLGDYHLAKSAELNPNDARILLRIGYYRSFLGDLTNDINYIDRAFLRNPLRPDFYWQNRGVVLFAHGEYDEALQSLLLSDNRIEQTRIYTAACHSALGNMAKAKSITKQLRNQNPDISLSWLRRAHPYRCYQDKSMLDHLTDLLGAAGL